MSIQKSKSSLGILLVTLLAIIMVVELSGKIFYETGLIHLLAAIYVVLALTRFFKPPKITDPILKKFVTACLIALLVFVASHLAEFIGFKFFGEYQDATFANVANLFIVSLLLILMGVEFIFRARKERGPGILILLGVLIFAALTLFTAFFVKGSLISLEPDKAAPYIYSGVVVLLALMAWLSVRRVRLQFPLLAGFGGRLMVGIILIILAIVPNTLYELLEDIFKMPEYQIIYLAHFGFFAALTWMYLAFGEIRLGGVYEAVEKK